MVKKIEKMELSILVAFFFQPSMKLTGAPQWVERCKLTSKIPSMSVSGVA